VVGGQVRQGTLHGLGVGPGDPELLTLKAVRLLAGVPVVAYPAPEGGESLARAIAAPHVPPGRIEIAIETPMAPGRHPANDVYDKYGAEIAGHLEAGRDVAALCEGDPFFFGSFMYLFERLSPKFRCVVVPGVSSLGACAAAARLPLASRLDVVTILPGPLDDEAVAARLSATGSAAIMKVGRHFSRLKNLLQSMGLSDRAWLVERATMEGERVRALMECSDEESVPYFSTILVSAP